MRDLEAVDHHLIGVPETQPSCTYPMKCVRSVYEDVLAEDKHLLEAYDRWGLQMGRWSAGEVQMDLNCFTINLRSTLVHSSSLYSLLTYEYPRTAGLLILFSI